MGTGYVGFRYRLLPDQEQYGYMTVYHTVLVLQPVSYVALMGHAVNNCYNAYRIYACGESVGEQ